MKREEAERLIAEKVKEATGCPFCGRIPDFEIYCEKGVMSGNWMHCAIRHSCCSATKSGQTDLFFTTGNKGPDFGLWKSMAFGLIDDWNHRVPQPTTRRDAELMEEGL